MSNKEALLQERLIQIKKDEIERLEFSDGLEFGLTDIKKHIEKISPRANCSRFSESQSITLKLQIRTTVSQI